MKKYFLIIILIIVGTSTSFAQNDNINIGLNYSLGYKPGTDNFTFDGKTIGNYSLGWYPITGSAEARLSGYGGIGFFTERLNRMYIAKNGNVGIGTTNPTSRLDILSNAGQTENLLKFRVADAPGDYLQFSNITSSAGKFIPSIKGFHQTDNRASLYIVGATSDNMDTGANVLIDFNARTANSKIQNRPLFSWTNYTTRMMTMTANGNLGIGTNNPGAKLHVSGNQLGENAGDQSILATFESKVSNQSKLQILNKRNENGTDWLKTSLRLQKTVDATEQAFIDFGIDGKTGSSGLGFGTRNGYNGTPQTRMVISENGKVGIGTTNPEEKLHINGNIRGNAPGGALKIKTSDGYLDLGPQNEYFAHIYTDRPKIIFNKDIYTTTNAFSSYNNDLILKTAGIERLRIDNTNGNVGIGTNNPTNGRLVVQQSENKNTSAFAIKANSTNQSTYFWMDNNNIMHIDNAVNASRNIVLNGTGNGNVGIGTTDTKGYKLGVNGKIAATEVKIALYNAWPDYVFEEAYKLPTLQEVENHIETKGHLINIPSATEVTKNGIMVGEMNAKLLEKIEELTLYTIAQEKKLNEQEERLAKLEALLLMK